MRCDPRPAHAETLVQKEPWHTDDRPSRRDERCVGVAVEPIRADIVYWTQNGPRRCRPTQILRTGIDRPQVKRRNPADNRG